MSIGIRHLVGSVVLSATACTTIIGLPDLPDIARDGASGFGGTTNGAAGASGDGVGARAGGGDAAGGGEGGAPPDLGGSGSSNVAGASGAACTNLSGCGGTSAAGSSSSAGTGAGGKSSGGMSGMTTGGTNSGGGGGTGGTGGTGVSGAGGSGPVTAPCDIYRSGSTPCVAAHSTVRALFGAYNGKLYQVRNAAGTTKDILTVAPGGVADSTSQDVFCAGTTCVITVVYDQSGKGNDLQYQGTGSPVGGNGVPANATAEVIKVFGKKAYSLYINQNSYWVDGSSKGMPTGAAPEGMYMVTSSKNYNSSQFDYGNSVTGRVYAPGATMDAVSFTASKAWGYGLGAGPWVMADLEDGLYAQGDSKQNVNDPTQTAPFVTAVLKNNGTSEFALRGGSAMAGNLSTYYKGVLPPGHNPMKKQGAIMLGASGDCCLSTSTNFARGTFYEGCIVAGYPSDATEDAVQANIVSANYSTVP